MLRRTLYTVWDNPAWLIGVQPPDGVGAGLIGALFPVVAAADLTRGSGRFNAAQGAVGTVHGLGGIIGSVFSGFLVVGSDYDVAFLTLAAIAVLGGLLFWARMPEWRDAPPVARAAGDRTGAAALDSDRPR
jgi:MFS family permease